MAGRTHRASPRAAMAVAPWVVTALLIGVLVIAAAAALLLIAPAQRPTLEPAPTTSAGP